MEEAVVGIALGIIGGIAVLAVVFVIHLIKERNRD